MVRLLGNTRRRRRWRSNIRKTKNEEFPSAQIWVKAVAMPKPLIVQAPAELLAFLFASWPELKKLKVRHWLKYQFVLVNERPVTQYNHPLAVGDVISIRAERHAVPREVMDSGLKIYFEDIEFDEKGNFDY